MIHKLIKERRSYRAFSDRQVEHEKLDLIFEAAGWAASSMNEQPWRFVYRLKESSGTEYTELFDTLSEGNKKWAGKAPVLIAVLAKKNFDYQNRPNRHYLYDTGQAVATMMLQVTELGLIAHQMGGFHMDAARAALGLDDIFEIAVIIALGYPGDPDQLPDDLKERELAPRTRKSLSEIAFKNKMKF